MTVRRSRSRSSRLRPFWFVGSAAFALAIALGYFAVTWSGFDAKHVRVVGNRVVPSALILARARVDRHENMWLQNTAAMAKRVDAIPYVLRTTVHRLPPSTVTIAVTERQPFAIVRSGNENALVDVHLRVLEDDPTNVSLSTIVVSPATALVPGRFLTQPGIVAMREALVSLRAHDVNVQVLEDNTDGVTATLAGGVQVLLGDESSIGTAAPLVEPILTRFALLGRFVQTLDLRSPTTPVVTERHGTRKARASKRARAAKRNAARNP